MIFAQITCLHGGTAPSPEPFISGEGNLSPDLTPQLPSSAYRPGYASAYDCANVSYRAAVTYAPIFSSKSQY